MATGATSFPSTLDTDATLLTAVDNGNTLLNTAVGPSDVSFSLADGSRFPSANVGRIEDEYIIWDSKADADTLSTITRGAYGSTATSHPASAVVRMTVMGIYHEAVKDAVIAIETKLGYGSDTAAANEVLRGIGSGQSDWGQITNAYIASGAAIAYSKLDLTGAILNADLAGSIAISKLSISGTPTGAKFLRDDGSWQTPSGASVADGDKGDITVSSSGTVWSIDNDTVTYAKMQNVSAASKLLGRGSAGGAGDPEEITIGSGLSMSGTTLSATGGGSAAWSAITDPSGNLSLAMGSNLTTLTWAGNYSTSSAFKLAGNNTSATGPLVEFSSAASNNMSVLLLKPRGGRSFEADKLGSLLLGKDAPGNTDTDGYVYLGIIGSNLFPSGTPTSNTGFAPITVQSDGVNDVRSIWLYAGSKWNDIGGVHKRYDTNSGSGAQTIDFNSSTSAVVARQFTASGGNATLTFSNAPKAGTLVIITIIQDGTGSRTITWPASVKWSGGTAPTLTTTASKRDVFAFMYDGSNYYNIAQTLNL